MGTKRKLVIILIALLTLWMKTGDGYAGGLVINPGQTFDLDSNTLKVPTGDITIVCSI